MSSVIIRVADVCNLHRKDLSLIFVTRYSAMNILDGDLCVKLAVKQITFWMSHSNNQEEEARHLKCRCAIKNADIFFLQP
jgi:hypothetical protein